MKEDSAFLQREHLWKAFRMCEVRAQAKYQARRYSSLQKLNGVEWSREARDAIDPATIARIRSGAPAQTRVPGNAVALSSGTSWTFSQPVFLYQGIFSAARVTAGS